MQDVSVAQNPPVQPQASASQSTLLSQLRSSFGVTPPAPQSDLVGTMQQALSEPDVADTVASQGQRLDIFSAVLDQIEAERQPSPSDATQQQPDAVVTSAQNQSVMAATAPALAPAETSASADSATVLDQMVPSAVLAATDTLNVAPAAGSVAKERVAASPATAVETATGIQYVEQEPSPEIPVEVETFIQRVEDHTQTSPNEIVIADGTHEQSSAAYPSRPVVVLPITQQTDDVGAKKSPKFSIRWLIEWSHKIIKMFAGKVIYRPAQTE